MLLAAVVTAAVAMPVAVASGAGSGARPSAASQIKQLQAQTRALQKQAKALAAESAGLSAKLAALEGKPPPGAPGGPSGAAGGSLSGNYPNPGIAANAVGGAQIVDNAITTADLAEHSVGSDDLAFNVVGALALTPMTIKEGNAAPVDGTRHLATSTAQCPPNTRLISGGFRWELPAGEGSVVMVSRPSPTEPQSTWEVEGEHEATGANNKLIAIAYCVTS